MPRSTTIVAIVLLLATHLATAKTIIQIIDSTGDGVENALQNVPGIAVDDTGNVFVTGQSSDNAFKITSDGVIKEIIGSTGDGAGNILDNATQIAVDEFGHVYVTVPNGTAVVSEP